MKGDDTGISGAPGSVELYKRFSEGDRCIENDWDYHVVPETATYLKEKYNIEFGKAVISDDGDLLDSLFEAGLELLVDCGMYCPDFGRVAKFNEDEIWDGIDQAPRKVVMGQGKDAVTLDARHGSARRRPLLSGGPTAGAISENLFTKTMESYAQESIVDVLFCGIMETFRGEIPKLGSPMEMHRLASEMRCVDIARTNAGRPGMAIIGPESALAVSSRISVDLRNGGMHPLDAHDIPFRNEMKVDTMALNMLAAAEINGSVVMSEELPIFGGYCGGPEETAIVDVATTIAAMAIFGADFHTDGPIHIKWGTTTNRETLRILAHVAGALDRNTNFLLGSMFYTAAGPCTEMCFLENAAQAIVDAVTGREICSTSASARGVVIDKTTGMEARFAGKVLQASSGMKVDDANYVLDTILKECESYYSMIPEGSRFSDCYYVDQLRPTNKHYSVYNDAMDKLRNMGLNVRN